MTFNIPRGSFSDIGEQKEKSSKSPNTMANLKDSGRMDMVRRWSRVRKSVETDDRSMFLGAFLGSVAVASMAYFVWQHYNKPTRK